MGSAMVEAWAAVAGASISTAALGISEINRQSRQGRFIDSTDSSCGQFVCRLDILHTDIGKQGRGSLWTT